MMMMIQTFKEAELTAKEENGHGKMSHKAAAASSSSSSSPWSRSKDPRVVRVSRGLGSKDRHTKVCTARGLRDRRVRLSVPTAIKLYHLEDLLGFNQPSKAVDWLLNAAKHQIDQLPPRPITPPPHHHQELGLNHNKKNNNNNTLLDHHQCQSKVAEGAETSDDKDHHAGGSSPYVLSNNFLLPPGRPNNNYSFLPPGSLLNYNNNLMSSSSYINSLLIRFDPSNLSLSHHPLPDSEAADYYNLHNFNVAPLPYFYASEAADYYNLHNFNVAPLPYFYASQSHHHHHNNNNPAAAAVAEFDDDPKQTNFFRYVDPDI